MQSHLNSNLYPPLPVNTPGETLTDGYASVALANMFGVFVDPERYLLKCGDLYLVGLPFMEDDVLGGNVVHQRDVEQIGPIVRMVVTRPDKPEVSWVFTGKQIMDGTIKVTDCGELEVCQLVEDVENWIPIVPQSFMVADGAAYIVSPRPMDNFVLSEILNYPEEDSAAT